MMSVGYAAGSLATAGDCWWSAAEKNWAGSSLGAWSIYL